MSEQRFPEDEPILQGEQGDELLDAGPPADGIADPEGSSGAQEGLSPYDDDSYSDDPQGPSQVAGD